jgi:riboflavin biosynthesis pyrimidine reductase
MQLQTLYESSELPRFELPAELERLYGVFGLSTSVVYANFVSTIDGIAAVPGHRRSSAMISGGYEGDRFVVALLRSVADAVVIGAGTFREHKGPWTAAAAHPELADSFAELRRGVATGPSPQLVVVTSSGGLEGSGTKLRDVVVATTEGGAHRLASDAGDIARVETFGSADTVDVRAVVEWLRDEGHRRILTEGGPHLMGDMLAAGVVDELFLTVSPFIAGGGRSEHRPGFAGGVSLLPDATVHGDVLSVRSANDYLFLRYALETRVRPGD